MSKGLYIRRIHKLDTCEWKHKEGSKRYPCSNKAERLVDHNGEIFKLCKKHKIKILGKKVKQCANCGCFTERN